MNNLTVFNTDVIPAYITDTGEKVVIGRELHQKLGIGKHYKDWFPYMCAYGFEENLDYYTMEEKVAAQKRARTYNQKNHILTLDMAKHIAMIQRTPQGKKIRQKLIDLEKVVSEEQEIPNKADDIFNFAFGDRPDRSVLNETDKFMKCAEIMANCKEPNRNYVVNILKHIVPDIGDVKDTRRNNATNYMNATEVGKFFGVSARVMNVVLEEQGLQYKNEYGRWELTDFGKTYGLEISYHTKNSYGANVRWYPEVVEYLKGEKVLEK